MKQPKYLSPAGYEAVATYIRQALGPETYPEPDATLLLIEPLHGPITHVELATIEGRLQVAASLNGRNLRYFDPLDFCAITLALAFGMGLSCNDTGHGMTYPRFRVVEPKGQAIHLLRVLTDAQPWDVAKQHPAEGPRPDYHRLSRGGLTDLVTRRPRQTSSRWASAWACRLLAKLGSRVLRENRMALALGDMMMW